MANRWAVVTPLPPGVVFRLATPRDQSGVIGMGNMLDQLDYLDFIYPYYMSSPEFHCYLLERNGRPICFAYLYIVDDGETMIGGAGRTDPEFQGKGYLTLLRSRATIQTLRRLDKKPTRLVFTSLYTQFHEELFRRQPGIYKIFMRRQLLSRKATKGNISSIVYSKAFQELEINFSTQIWMPTDQEIATIVADHKTKDQLFPDGHFIAIFQPFKTTLSNMTLARKTSNVFVSGDMSAGIIKALSLVSEIPCTTGLRYDLEFYGNDTTDAMQHVYSYLRNLTTGPLSANTPIEIILCLPLWIDKAFIERQIADYGWDLGSWSVYPVYTATEVQGFASHI